MAKPHIRLKRNQKGAGEEMFLHASKMLESGDAQSAFALFLAAAKAGHKASQLNVGHCYDTGSGIRRNRASALYWYTRAYKQGDAHAANNIGTIYRDERKLPTALKWFKRAVSLGNDGSNLEIAKYLLSREGDHPKRALRYLEKVSKSDHVSEAEAEEANDLIREVQKNRMRTK